MIKLQLDTLSKTAEGIAELWTTAEVNRDLLKIASGLQQSEYFLSIPPTKREDLVNLLKKLGELNMACHN